MPTPSPASAALRQALNQINPLDDAAWAAIAGLVSHRSLSAGEHLLRAGQRATRVCFIQAGLLREYYLDASGKESTRRFCLAGDFSGSLADLLRQDGATVSIQALAPCDIQEIDWLAFDSLTDTQPSLMKLMRRFAEGLYVRKTLREFEMLTLPASERYRRFTQDYPELDRLLPRHLIASYLGITPVHLSRISTAGKRRPGQAKPAEKS